MTSSGTVGQDDYILAVFPIFPKIKVQGACLTADWLFHSCLVEVRAPPVLQIIIHQGLRLSNKSSKKHIFMSFICLCRSKTRDNFHQCSSKANNPHAVNKNPQWKKTKTKNRVLSVPDLQFFCWPLGVTKYTFWCFLTQNSSKRVLIVFPDKFACDASTYP